MACTTITFLITLFTCTTAMFCKEKELGYKCCANYYWDSIEEKCSQCMPGYFGLNCSSECEDGYYGKFCGRKCPENCTSCDKVDGVCSECMPGYIGLNCSVECEDGYYGQYCLMKCPENCISCDKVDGVCSGVYITDPAHQSTISSNMTIMTLPTQLRKSKRGSFYAVISVGSSAVLVLVVVLLKNIYSITTLPPSQTFLLKIQDPESEAAQNTINPAFDPVYEDPA